MQDNGNDDTYVYNNMWLWLSLHQSQSRLDVKGLKYAYKAIVHNEQY